MAYLQELIQTQEQYVRQQQVYSTVDMGLRKGEAYASYFPSWEVTAPQYVVPTAYTLANLGYRTNEVAYACIDLWMKTISEPKIKVYDKKAEEFIDDHPLYEFTEEICPDVSETDYWNAVVMYLKIAGFIGWEKDRANDGSLIALWPMLPQYCSFMRGQKRLLRAVHYQPYTGLPGIDIPRDRINLYSYIDPLYFGLKPFSPTMVIKDIIGLDNNMTTMIDQFTKNGAFLGGLLKTEQVINDADARFARERWRETHGGPSNAGEIAVLGKGMEFQTTNGTFRDMVFPEVDARSEVRICMAYGVKPILVSAKVGMDRSTMNNYKEGKSSWYEENVTSEWQFLEERFTKDVLREFDADKNHICKFDTSEIKALQEDRNSQWERAREAYKARIITRNDALTEMNMEILEDEELGKEYYATAMEQTSMSIQDDLDQPNATETNKETEVSLISQDKVKVEEEKSIELVLEGLRAAIKRLSNIPAAEQPQKRDEEMIINIHSPANVDVTSKETVKAIASLVDRIDAMGKAIKAAPAPAAPVINVTVEPTPIEVKNKIDVSPTPIENKVEVKTPKLKKETRKVQRDKLLNLEGTISEFEYEEDK